LTGASVIPVGIWGVQQRWGKNGLTYGRPLRPVVGVAFGPPVVSEGDAKDRTDVRLATDRIMEALDAQVGVARRLA
jgi:hypothetical protein